MISNLEQFASRGLKAQKDLDAILAQVGQPERKCIHCGCTDSHACPGGCSWFILHKNKTTGVCTRCAHKEGA